MPLFSPDALYRRQKEGRRRGGLDMIARASLGASLSWIYHPVRQGWEWQCNGVTEVVNLALAVLLVGIVGVAILLVGVMGMEILLVGVGGGMELVVGMASLLFGVVGVASLLIGGVGVVVLLVGVGGGMELR